MRDPQDREVELSFWESVRSSNKPSLIQAYLEKYPQGEFCALAQIQLAELKSEHKENDGSQSFSHVESIRPDVLRSAGAAATRHRIRGRAPLGI
jgi:hypothetical protein